MADEGRTKELVDKFYNANKDSGDALSGAKSALSSAASGAKKVGKEMWGGAKAIGADLGEAASTVTDPKKMNKTIQNIPATQKVIKGIDSGVDSIKKRFKELSPSMKGKE